MLLYSTLICVVIVLSLYFFFCCRNVFFIKKLNTLPGPKTLPFIGNSHLFIGKEFLDILLKMTEDYSSPFQFWLGSKLLIMIHEPDDAKTILHHRDCLDKSELYKFMQPLFGNNSILTAPASIWTRVRKVVSPTFSPHMLQNFCDIFVQESIKLTEKLENDLNKDEINLEEYLSNYTWRMACGSMMGIKLEPNINNQYVEVMKRLKNIMLHRTKNLLLSSDILFYFTALGRRQKRDTKILHLLADQMIQQRINNLEAENQIFHYKTFFDILMARKENLTKEEIHDNVITMLVTASDTITVTINFAIFMMANYPKVQERVYDELVDIYGTENIKSATIKCQDLQHMHYLEQIIKETMRIFPIVPFIGRKITKDLKIGEVTLPKDTNIIIQIFAMHRNKKYWPNPLMFDPDRFLPEKTNSQSYYYLPFSDGPRICTGMKFAIMCMKVILASLIRTFVFKVNKSIEIDKIKLKFNTILSTEKPLKVKIEKRNYCVKF